MKRQPVPRLETDGFSRAGLWVRRLRSAPSLTEEALSLAQVLHTWNLTDLMQIAEYRSHYAEVSSPALQPTWVYLVELTGRPSDERPLPPNHPLSRASPCDEVRIVALVQPPDFHIPGALVETPAERRLLWLQEAAGR